MKDNKHTAVVFAADDKSAFALGAALISLKENSPELFKAADIFVYTQDLSETNKKAILEICPVKFELFKLPFDSSAIQTIVRYSELTMARYECFNLLSWYKNVVWLDIDILVQKELYPVLAKNTTGWAWAHDDNILASNFDNTPADLDKKIRNFNAGVLFLSQKLPDYKNMAQWCYLYTKENAPQLLWIDQAVLNAAVQKLKIKVTVLPREYNASPMLTPIVSKRAYILHAMGEYKFWNSYPMPQWHGFYLQWLKAGGTPMPAQKVSKKVLFCFKTKLIIENIPFLWPIFKLEIKRRFWKLNRAVLRKQEK